MRNKIKDFLGSRGITPYKFWKDTAIAQRTAYDLYNNSSQYPAREVMDKICSTYRVQPGDLLEWVESEDEGDRVPAEPIADIPTSAPKVPKTRRRTGKQVSSSAQSFQVGDCVRLPSGDRAFVDGFKDGRVLVTWEVGKMKDSFPAHLLTFVCKAA